MAVRFVGVGFSALLVYLLYAATLHKVKSKWTYDARISTTASQRRLPYGVGPDSNNPNSKLPQTEQLQQAVITPILRNTRINRESG